MTTNTKFPCAPLWMAAVGMTVAFGRCRRTRRTLTNWLAKSALSVLSNTALSLAVPVVVSIWLSMVSSVPAAILWASERS